MLSEIFLFSGMKLPLQVDKLQEENESSQRSDRMDVGVQFTYLVPMSGIANQEYTVHVKGTTIQ